jgi:hypothetical protein
MAVTAGAIHGRIVVATAGTAVVGDNCPGSVFLIKALAGNAGLIYIGNVLGDVAAANGYELSPGEEVQLVLPNLKHIFVDSASNGDAVCWIRQMG